MHKPDARKAVTWKKRQKARFYNYYQNSTKGDSTMSQVTENKNMNNQEEINFQKDLTLIVTSGENLKEALQRAIRYATKRVVFNMDCKAVDALDGKLQLLQSDYYLKMLRKNFAAFCMDCEIVFEKNETRFYYREKPAITYCKEKGKTGWRINKSLFNPRAKKIKENYNTYAHGIVFAAMKVREHEEKKTLEERLVARAKALIDESKKYRDAAELWQGIDNPYIKIIKYLADMPIINVPEK